MSQLSTKRPDSPRRRAGYDLLTGQTSRSVEPKTRRFLPTCLVLSLLVPALALVLTGCGGLIGDFTMATTKNVSMDSPHQRVGKTEAQEGKIFSPPSLKIVVDKALDNAGPEATYLTNVRIHQKVFLFWTQMRVEGEAWAPSGTTSQVDPTEEVYHLETTEDGVFMVSSTDRSKREEVFIAR